MQRINVGEETVVNDTSRRNDRIEEIEDQHQTTADLAGVGQEERPQNADDHLPSSGAPVEVIKAPREQGREFAGPASGRASAATGTAVVMAKDPESGPLFSQEEAGNLRVRWDAIQVGFVDEPRRAVEEADSLVADAMKRLAEQFSEERSKLEGQWDRGGDVSTEDLRIALRRYRSFFGRLLAV
jgi:hypothetical protein